MSVVNATILKDANSSLYKFVNHYWKNPPVVILNHFSAIENIKTIKNSISSLPK